MRETASSTSSRSLAPSAHRGASARGVLRVSLVTDEAQLPGLAATWDALLDADPNHPGAVFRSGAWLLSWWKTFSSGKELRVYIAEADGRMVGVLPAYRQSGPVKELGTPRLRLLGDGIVGSDYLGVIAKPEDRTAAAEAIARAILLEEEAATLDGLADDDELSVALAAACSDGSRGGAGRLVKEPLLPCPTLTIARGLSFEAWSKALPDGAGAQLKRRRRWLEKQPGYALTVAKDEEDVVRALADLWRLHHLRWSVEGGSDAIDSPLVERFHEAAARAIARRGWARVFTISVSGEARAALYGFVRGDRFAFYQSGNDPAWRQRSVGTVVLGASIEHAFAAGLREYDFLRGNESYKATFADGARQLVRLRVASSRRAVAAEAIADGLRGARQIGKRLLGDEAVEWFRRQRRRARALTTRGAAGPVPEAAAAATEIGAEGGAQ